MLSVERVMFILIFNRIQPGIGGYMKIKIARLHCILCNVFHALYSMHCIICIVLYSLYSMHCILCIVYYALYSMHCIICIVFFALYNMHCMIYIVLWLKKIYKSTKCLDLKNLKTPELIQIAMLRNKSNDKRE